jgi:hypothetical protein
VGVDEAREVGGSDWVVEDVFANYEIGKVKTERRVHVEGGLAQPHHPEGQPVEVPSLISSLKTKLCYLIHKMKRKKMRNLKEIQQEMFFNFWKNVILK